MRYVLNVWGNKRDPNLIHPLCVAAIRELWEETGLILGAKGFLER